MRQDGSIMAVRRVRLARDKAPAERRPNGIAISPDTSKIWVTTTGHLAGYGAVLELPSFPQTVRTVGGTIHLES